MIGPQNKQILPSAGYMFYWLYRMETPQQRNQNVLIAPWWQTVMYLLYFAFNL